MIKEALTNNYNVRIAATAIMQAQANLGITRANQFPSLAGSFAIQNERNSAYPGAPTFDRHRLIVQPPSIFGVNTGAQRNRRGPLLINEQLKM